MSGLKKRQALPWFELVVDVKDKQVKDSCTDKIALQNENSQTIFNNLEYPPNFSIMKYLNGV